MRNEPMVLEILAAVVLAMVSMAGAWDHLSYQEAESLQEWQVDHCTNYLAGVAGTVQASAREPPRPCPALTDGLRNGTAVEARAFPTRIEVPLVCPATINAVAWWQYATRRGDRSAPWEYSIEVRGEGDAKGAWTTVVDHYKMPWDIGEGRRVHTFAPIKARAVAMVLHAPAKYGPGKSVLAELGAYNLAECRDDADPAAPPWADANCNFRSPVAESADPASSQGIRRWADFTALLGDRIGWDADPRSAVIVLCHAVAGKWNQRPFFTIFQPDARYDEAKSAVGMLTWKPGPAEPGIQTSAWIYFRACEVSPDCRAAVSAAKGRRDAYTTSNKDAPSPTIQGKLAFPLYNYRRGDPINCAVTLSQCAGLKGKLLFRMTDDRREVFRKEYPLAVDDKGQARIECPIETANLAARVYCVEAQATFAAGATAAPAWASRGWIQIVPPRRPSLPVGIYGLPHASRMYALRYLADAQRHNITLDNGHYGGGGNAFYYDMAAAFGVDIAPTANEVLWHYGLLKDASPARAIDGTAANWACFLDSVTQKWAVEGLVKLLGEMKQYPSFAGKIGYHDDVGMQSVSKGKDTLLCCYCPRCREAFKKQTGKDLPTAMQANWPTGVVPDDDPWVHFSLFRSRDCLGGLTRMLEEAKARVAPDVTMGTYTVKTFNPQAGYYGPGNFSRSSAVSSYTYPRAGLRDNEAIIQHELGVMGNRHKDAWLLMWIGGVAESEWTKVASPGEVRLQFWNMLAAGSRQVSYFLYGTPGTGPQYCIEGTDALEELGRVGAVAKRVGGLYMLTRPAEVKVGVLASWTDISCRMARKVSDWWTARDVFRDAFFGVLDTGLVPLAVAEEELLAGEPKDLRAIVVPNVKYLRQGVIARLAEFARRGGRVLTVKDMAIDIPGAERFARATDLCAAARKIAEPLPVDPRSPYVTVRHLAGPGVNLHVLVNQNTGREDREEQPLGFLRRLRYRYGEAVPVPVDAVVADANAAYYDLVAGRRIPVRKGESLATLGITVPAAGGCMLVSYPQQVGSVRLAAPKTAALGATATISIEVLSESGAISQGAHLLEVTVITPNGRSEEYSQLAVAQGGKLSLSLALAVNDLPGDWQVTAKEAASGIQGATAFVVTGGRTDSRAKSLDQR